MLKYRKYSELLLNRLKTLPYFDREALRSIADELNIKEATVNTCIRRAILRKDILQLKRGLYVKTKTYEENCNDVSYILYLANVMRVPSYVSSWTALSYYDLATDYIGVTTSVTPKITRKYVNITGGYLYHSIKPELFTGYELANKKFPFYIATPAKALFDLIYFRTRGFRGLKIDDVLASVEDLRIDLAEMKKNDRGLFSELVKKQLNSR